jgi:hypothetical protein
MRLTRHAKNGLRRVKGTLEDAEGVIAEPIGVDHDDNGKPRYTGEIGGVPVRIVVAVDEPDLIVTIHDRRR